jgi:hypothetical protein
MDETVIPNRDSTTANEAIEAQLRALVERVAPAAPRSDDADRDRAEGAMKLWVRAVPAAILHPVRDAGTLAISHWRELAYGVMVVVVPLAAATLVALHGTRW